MTDPAASLAPQDRGRIRWRCRRGMRELDVLLEGYLNCRFDHAPAAEQQAFLRLLDCEDPDIWSWLLGYTPPPAELVDVVAKLRAQP
ncbi:MAG: succinate dehydrogenase assembly factor 2 [Nevskia sp.]|nr:succinate dehydrogenase assembly factor 2 [Nevskia sp.]